MKLAEKSTCCGCSACHDACANNAITMEMERGFLYPHIDEQKCANCGRCTTVCPVLTRAENDETEDEDFEPTAWAAWNTDEAQRRGGASGGIFSALASYIIELGGYVCGCEFSDDFRSCHHVVINKADDIPKLMHSKYMQSEMRDVYSSIKALLVKGETVMFCATPCQCAALFNYLTVHERENLLLVDVFCKGVPSPVVHAKYVEFLEKKYRRKIKDYYPKCKDRGWGKFFTRIEFDDGSRKYIRSSLDSLFVGKSLNVRPSCTSCSYKGLDKPSDISIGDYWGVTGLPADEVHKGVSAIVANTERGAQILAEAGERIIKEQRTLFDVSNAKNPGYSQQIVLGKEYQQFFDEIESKPMNKVLKEYAQNNSVAAIALRKAKWAWLKVCSINLLQFVYLNFLSKHVKRGKGAYLIPGSHAIFEFSKGSELIVEHGRSLINFRKPRRSKVESWIALNENARMIVHNGIDIRNSRIIVQKDARLEIGDLEMNGLCNVVVRKQVTIGNDVMIARDVNIYDSDYHPFSIGDGVSTVVSKPVNIGDHVWIGNGASITKGVTIGEGSVISTKSVVIRNVKPQTMVSGNPAKEMCRDVYWSKGRIV